MQHMLKPGDVYEKRCLENLYILDIDLLGCRIFGWPSDSRCSADLWAKRCKADTRTASMDLPCGMDCAVYIDGNQRRPNLFVSSVSSSKCEPEPDGHAADREFLLAAAVF